MPGAARPTGSAATTSASRTSTTPHEVSRTVLAVRPPLTSRQTTCSRETPDPSATQTGGRDRRVAGPPGDDGPVVGKGQAGPPLHQGPARTRTGLVACHTRLLRSVRAAVGPCGTCAEGPQRGEQPDLMVRPVSGGEHPRWRPCWTQRPAVWVRPLTAAVCRGRCAVIGLPRRFTELRRAGRKDCLSRAGCRLTQRRPPRVPSSHGMGAGGSLVALRRAAPARRRTGLVATALGRLARRHGVGVSPVPAPGRSPARTIRGAERIALERRAEALGPTAGDPDSRDRPGSQRSTSTETTRLLLAAELAAEVTDDLARTRMPTDAVRALTSADRRWWMRPETLRRAWEAWGRRFDPAPDHLARPSTGAAALVAARTRASPGRASGSSTPAGSALRPLRPGRRPPPCGGRPGARRAPAPPAPPGRCAAPGTAAAA